MRQGSNPDLISRSLLRTFGMRTSRCSRQLHVDVSVFVSLRAHRIASTPNTAISATVQLRRAALNVCLRDRSETYEKCCEHESFDHLERGRLEGYMPKKNSATRRRESDRRESAGYDCAPLPRVELCFVRTRRHNISHFVLPALSAIVEGSVLRHSVSQQPQELLRVRTASDTWRGNACLSHQVA